MKKASKKETPPIVLSLEDKINEACKRFHFMGFKPQLGATPNPDFLPEEGELVEVGNLRGVTVVRLVESDAGTIVIIRVPPTRPGEDDDIRAEHYTEVFRPTKQKKTQHFQRSLLSDIVPINSDLNTLVQGCIRGSLQLTADYQRGYVWQAADQQAFLDSVMNGRALGTFVIVRQGHPLTDELLDGKQRVTTLLKFVNNEITYRGNYWAELSRADRYQFLGRNVSHLQVHNNGLKKSELLRIFLEVNSAGVPQTEEHLVKVRQMLLEAQAKEATA